MREDCDCYTDSDGYWQLGPGCLQDEQNQWSAMMRRWEDDGGRMLRSTRHPQFVWWRGKLTLVEVYQLPEDEED